MSLRVLEPRGLAAAVAAGALVAAVVLACSAPDESAQITPGSLDKAGFEAVTPMLNRRCGSLDCHGSRFRNLRIYGYGGLRLATSDTPESPRTTPGEAGQNYEAVMGLEPEAMGTFLAEGRSDPSRLTLYRKARAEEKHKGGMRISPGDAADVCLVSWLTAVVDTESCKSAAAELNPLDD